MKKFVRVFVAVALSLLLLAGVVSARIAWWPSVRTPLDMQMAIYGQYGYQPPITNVYGNENVNIVDSWSSWVYGDYSDWISIELWADTAGDVVIEEYYSDEDKTDDETDLDESES